MSVQTKPLSEITQQALTVLMQERVRSEASRVDGGLNIDLVGSLVSEEFARLTAAVANNSTWKTDLPGRTILHKFAALAGIQHGRLKQLYLREADVSRCFEDIVKIFQDFRENTG